jgi:hypothetical protein
MELALNSLEKKSSRDMSQFRRRLSNRRYGWPKKRIELDIVEAHKCHVASDSDV